MYKYIIVDTANLFYRLAGSSTTSEEIAKKMVTWTKSEALSRLEQDGKLYLLFDPISFSDLGEAKNFYINFSERKSLLPDYKAGRKYSKLYFHTIEIYRKYYLYREVANLIYSREHEADDYVEPLLQKLKSENESFKLAMVTTDYDWARYIESNENYSIDMINDNWDNPYTVKRFVEQFEFSPTIGANTAYKAFFGDESDNIDGAVFMKKAKFINNIKVLVRDYLKEVSESNASVEDIIKQFKNAKFSETHKKEEKSAFDVLFTELYIASLKVPIIDKFLTNMRVISSSLSGKNIERFIHNNKDKPEINNVIHQALFGISFSSQFGKLD